jgi:hypothetical protein
MFPMSTNPYTTYTIDRHNVSPGTNRVIKPNSTYPMGFFIDSHEIELAVGAPLPFHHKYGHNCQTYNFWEGSYRADHDYKHLKDCDNQCVFKKHINESEENAKFRKSISTVIGWCKPIIQKYNNFVTNSTIARDTKNEDFVSWCSNVDLYDTSLHDFMRKTFEHAQKLGVYYVLLDTNKDNDLLTEEQVKIAKYQPYLVKIHPNRLINWCMPDDEHFSEMLFLFPECGTARYYNNQNVIVIHFDPKDNEKKILSIEPPIPHGFPIIPIVKVNCDDDDASQIVQIAECQKSIFFLNSLLMEELAKQVFTSWMISGADIADLYLSNNPETKEGKPAYGYRELGARRFTCVNKQATITRLSSDPAQSEQLRVSIQMYIEQIYYNAGISPDAAARKSGNVESAKAHEIKFYDVANIARSLADHCELAENSILRLWSIATGQEVVATDYYDDFNDDTLGQQLQQTLNIIAANLPGTLKSVVVKEISNKLTKLTPEEEKAIGEEAAELYMSDEQEVPEVPEVDNTSEEASSSPNGAIPKENDNGRASDTATTNIPAND